MHRVLAFAVGLVFGIGLCLSGMSQPDKVLGFLDVAGVWDPSLAFVMAGAIGVAIVGFRVAGRRRTSWLGNPMQLPATTNIDDRLIVGSVLFGIGWGLAGICPGPALVDLGFLELPVAVFVAAMLTGMALFTHGGRFMPRTFRATLR